MADLASTRIYGNLNVTKDIITKGKIKGDGSELTNVASGITWEYHNANATITSGVGVFADTSSGQITITLPASPSNGDLIAFTDLQSSWGTNNLIVDGNGNSIIDTSATFTADVSSKTFYLVFYNTKWVFASETNFEWLIEDSVQDPSIYGKKGSENTWTAQQTFTELKYSTFTASTNIDPANGNIQMIDATSNLTVTESLEDGQIVILHLSGGDQYAITWPTATWTGGSVPELTAKDAIVLWKVGTTLYGSYSGTIA